MHSHQQTANARAEDLLELRTELIQSCTCALGLKSRVILSAVFPHRSRSSHQDISRDNGLSTLHASHNVASTLLHCLHMIIIYTALFTQPLTACSDPFYPRTQPACAHAHSHLRFHSPLHSPTTYSNSFSNHTIHPHTLADHSHGHHATPYMCIVPLHTCVSYHAQ